MTSGCEVRQNRRVPRLHASTVRGRHPHVTQFTSDEIQARLVIEIRSVCHLSTQNLR